MEGWISLYRKFIDWEWYTDANTMRVFIHLLLLANHQDNNWRGKEIKRGQLITSIKHLSGDLKLTPKQIRLSLEKLKSTQEIATQGTNQYTVITIEKYGLYQIDLEKKASQTANQGQTEGKQRATNNNDNNDNNENKNINSSSIVETYEKNIGTLTPITFQLLNSLIDDYEEEMILKAIEIATTSNKRNMNYVKGILKQWDARGFKKVVDIQDYQPEIKRQETKRESMEVRLARVKKMIEEEERCK